MYTRRSIPASLPLLHSCLNAAADCAHEQDAARMQILARLKLPSQPSCRSSLAMPPKSKQAARRANAKAAAKGAGKAHAALDEGAERSKLEREPPLQRGRVQELATRMAGSFDTTPDQMLPAALGASREVPELLETALRTGATTPVTVSHRGATLFTTGANQRRWKPSFSRGISSAVPMESASSSLAASPRTLLHGNQLSRLPSTATACSNQLPMAW